MEKYIGTTTITAEKITRGDFFTRRGLVVSDEVYSNMGYHMVCIEPIPDMWYPAEEFEKYFHPMDGLDFSTALAAIRDGFEVERWAWALKGKGRLAISTHPERLVLRRGHDKLACFAIWEPSTEDILAKDWRVCR